MPKSKSKLSKLIAPQSDTDDESEHELSYYIEDRVKLMKEILKIIKPKKMKSMAPECMRSMDMQEINSMLLEELLGISNKRLKYIFDGKTLEEESSTDEDLPVDVISLDDISDDDFIVISDDELNKPRHKHKRRKVKEEPATDKGRKVKKEKPDKNKVKDITKVKDKLSRGEKANAKEKDAIGEENLMSVLELLELQARARAIKSQLELENKKKQEEQQKADENNQKNNKDQDEDDDDEVIMQIPKEVEIVITSSDSENEVSSSKTDAVHRASYPKSTSETDSTVQINEKSEADATQKPLEDANIASKQSIKKPEIEANITLMSSTSNKGDSDSSSNDTLQVILEREKRKLQDKNCQMHKGNSERGEETSECISKEGPEGPRQQATSSAESSLETASKNSKIDMAIEEFMKTRPPSPHKAANLERLQQEEKKKRIKEKRLKSLKNRMESFKQDVAVETSTVNVLENIVIKPKTAHSDESDDLVINVDQDDVDCMICD